MFRPLGSHAVVGLLLASTIAAAHTGTPAAPPKNEQKVVFAGGCFWGVQLVFQHVKGVTRAVSGYAGGERATATYPQVGTGETGHAESVEVTFDTTKVSFEQLLKVFFTVVHDPTQLNRQGPDVGTEYRSVIFYTDDAQKRAAEAYVAQLTQSKAFSGPIVTQIVPLRGFYAAEAYHQNYATLNPNDPYIAYNDRPKLDHLKVALPDLYKAAKSD
jgi:peptide-methionine (S)-S-oxide reductase